MAQQNRPSSLYLLLFWTCLAIPWCWLVWLWLSGTASVHYLLHPSGKYGTRLMLVALAATPLCMMFPRASWARWLVQSRRHWGVASLAYMLLHTVFYLIDEGHLWDVIAGVRKPSFLFGWLAFAIVIVLGAISNNYSVKRLGTRWKLLQRWVYIAALFVFLHWILLGYNVLSGIYHFMPLVLLQIWRCKRQGAF